MQFSNLATRQGESVKRSSGFNFNPFNILKRDYER